MLCQVVYTEATKTKIQMNFPDNTQPNQSHTASLLPKWLDTAFLPSALSFTVTCLISLAVVGGVVAELLYKRDYAAIAASQSSQAALQDNYQTVGHQLAVNHFVSNAPFVILWGFVGWLTFQCIAWGIGAFKNIAQIRQELDYVNVDRKQFLRSIGLSYLARLVILVLWFVWIKLTLQMLIPYVIALADTVNSVGLLMAMMYAMSAFLLLAVVIHLHVIAIRLILMRPRLFG
jgi:hypothetical protein